MRKRKTVYLSGPMTGIPELNRPLFDRYAKALRQKGYKVINPPELDKHSPQRSWEGCLRRDLKEMLALDCIRIATLPQWKKSRGANLEVYVGKALKYKIHPVQHYL